MTNTTTTQSPARVEAIPAVMAGDVITHAGTDYYVEGEDRGELKMVRLHDLREGFKFPARGVTTYRRATDDERNRAQAAMVAKANADAAFRAGALVRTIKASKHVDPNTLYVIIKANSKSVSITELGGSLAGVVINAPRSALSLVELADVLK